MIQQQAEVVRRTVTVDASQDRAFEVFTARMRSWWPLDTHHIGKVDAVDVVVEPHEGGRCYERGVDGSECEWGRVGAWEPPARFVMLWMLNADWQFDPDEAHATEVDVRFVAESPTRTRVELTHSGFERMERGDVVRESVGGEGGWNGLLSAFAEAATAAAA
jgi:hypothetical protein